MRLKPIFTILAVALAIPATVHLGSLPTIAQGTTQGTAAQPAAANQCANLAEADCAGKQGCVWLPGYRIANGAEVPGYCRPTARSINARRPGSDPQPPPQR